MFFARCLRLLEDETHLGRRARTLALDTDSIVSRIPLKAALTSNNGIVGQKQSVHTVQW